MPTPRVLWSLVLASTLGCGGFKAAAPPGREPVAADVQPPAGATPRAVGPPATAARAEPASEGRPAGDAQTQPKTPAPPSAGGPTSMPKADPTAEAVRDRSVIVYTAAVTMAVY